ncbi:MAG: DMT family transporter [Hyphomicrobiales bacterium]
MTEVAARTVANRHPGDGRLLGWILVAAAATAWSLGGFFIRLIDENIFTILFWRGVFSGTAILFLFFYLEGSRAIITLRGLRWPTVQAALGSAVSMVCGMTAVHFTSVAEALIIYCLVPFITAAGAWLVISERASRATMIASGIALVGISIMMWGAALGGSLFGNLLAFGMAAGMAWMTIVLRQHRDVPMFPAMSLSAYMAAGFSATLAPSLMMTPLNFAYTAAFGVVQNAAGLVLFAIGARRISAAEAALIAVLEVPLGTLWVWLFFAETPRPSALVGGAVVLAAVIGHVLIEARR